MGPDLEIALLRTFVAVKETGSVTLAGRLVGRTQPAVTHQMHRLEKVCGTRLFEGDRRQGHGHVTLTRDGEVLLGYARTVLTLNDEIRGRFQAPDVTGRVRLGIPDLYASFLLPLVLSGFAQIHPKVEIEFRCSRSVHLLAALEREEIDIAVMTHQPELGTAATIREEPLIWVAADDFRLRAEEALPLALMPVGSIYRQHGLNALNLAGRSWTISAVSDSIAGLQAAVYAGLAISIFPLCALTPGLRSIGEAEGLPCLQPSEIVLKRKPSGLSPAAEHLAQYIGQQLRNT